MMDTFLWAREKTVLYMSFLLQSRKFEEGGADRSVDLGATGAWCRLNVTATF